MAKQEAGNGGRPRRISGAHARGFIAAELFSSPSYVSTLLLDGNLCTR
ncbi:MAG: hypothetical protein JRN48_04865 [Nitrososphaerota archaeon]|nr:hypothetical protein [Nitrososphaerota archaeon]